MDINKELEIIFELRENLITLYPDTNQVDKYLIANELLNELEKLIRKKVNTSD